MAILDKIIKKKNEVNFDRKNLSMEEEINLNILEFILKDKTTLGLMKFLVFRKDSFKPFSIGELKKNSKSKFSEKYLSKLLEPLVILGVLVKGNLKLEGDKRVKTYYQIQNRKKLLNQIDFKSKNLKDFALEKELPSKFNYSRDFSFSYVMKFFIRNEYNFKELENLILTKEDVVYTSVKLKIYLETLVNVGLLEKLYYQNQGDKRVKVYFSKTDLGKKYISWVILHY